MQERGILSGEKSSEKYVGDFGVEFSKRGYYNILVLFLSTTFYLQYKLSTLQFKRQLLEFKLYLFVYICTTNYRILF